MLFLRQRKIYVLKVYNKNTSPKIMSLFELIIWKTFLIMFILAVTHLEIQAVDKNW